MSAFAATSREDIAQHLRMDHGWLDNAEDGRRRADLVFADGRPLMSTADLLVVHRELTLIREQEQAMS